jgi:large subunit ribosomal protein L25
MQIIDIEGEKREPGGRHANERLRRRGMIPAIIYGHGEAPEAISVSRHDLEIALSASQHVVKLKMDSRQDSYLIKDVQYDHLQRDPLHVDLMRVDASERVRVNVAVELRGTPAGVGLGGLLILAMPDIEIECAVTDIPDNIRANVANMNIGDVLHVRELELPAGITAISPPDAVIATIRPPLSEAALAAAMPTEGAIEPEVIAKGKEEEGEGDK